MGMRYILGNYIDETTLFSVSSENAPAFGKENMYNKRQSRPWRIDGKVGQANFDFNSDRPTVLGIMNHNLVGTGAFSLKLKTAGAEVDLDAAIPESIDWCEQNICHIITTTPNQWWRIDVDDPDNWSSLEFGEIILYTYGTFSMNYWWPYKEALDYVVDENVTHYGYRHRTTRAKRKIFRLDFEGVKDADLVGAINEVEAFFEEMDGDLPFIFVPDSDKPDSWYVDCLNSMEATRVFMDNNKFFLHLEEQSRGILMQ